ncbi:MAG: putative type restriction-modification enzyme subunit [Microbacteriaceae bacterium]|nr:putative type restriction-modification enzyme subunit [Microbacteriaceae bacterium]
MIPNFLHYTYHYNLDARHDDLRGESTGDGSRDGLSLTTIQNLTGEVPDIGGQLAIAHAVGNVDDELNVLKVRPLKARQVKQGIWRELLIGPTRLMTGEEAA